MKMPIEWHQANLANMDVSLIRAENEVEKAKARYKRLSDSCDILHLQIVTAKKEGKIAFDCETYLINRKKK